jgi:citrate synthase
VHDEWIDAATAAGRLGVKPATLYAYVSRGVLRRRRDPEARRSLFDAAEVERLARRGKPRRKPAAAEIAIRSAVTALGADRPYYRGRDAVLLADSHEFESVAEWLWAGDFGRGRRWRARPDGVAAARAVQRALPGELLALDRLQLIVAALAVGDPLRHRCDTPAVIGTARALIAGMVEALPALSAPCGDTVAAVLWSRLCSRPPRDERELRALNAALVLLADHELAASTFAARVAASVRADPYAVVGAGLGVLGGPIHGGASRAVEQLLADIPDPSRVRHAVGDLLRRGERVPGAGHSVYRGGDARAGHLLGLVRELAPDHPKLAVAEAILVELRERRLPACNIDFALGTFAATTGMIGGCGAAIFAVARTAGWLAHAVEQYRARSPIRPRATPAVPGPP